MAQLQLSSSSPKLAWRRAHNRIRHRTSIGASDFSRPKNKHKRRQWKRYRGQG